MLITEVELPQSPSGEYAYDAKSLTYTYGNDPRISISYENTEPGWPTFRLKWGGRYVFSGQFITRRKILNSAIRGRHGKFTSVNSNTPQGEGTGYRSDEEMNRAVRLMRHFLWQAKPTRFPTVIEAVRLADFVERRLTSN